MDGNQSLGEFGGISLPKISPSLDFYDERPGPLTPGVSTGYVVVRSEDDVDSVIPAVAVADDNGFGYIVPVDDVLEH